jgi:hypothetical protein
MLTLAIGLQLAHKPLFHRTDSDTADSKESECVVPISGWRNARDLEPKYVSLASSLTSQTRNDDRASKGFDTRREKAAIKS